MKFYRAMCKVLHLDWGNYIYGYCLGEELTKSRPTGKDLGVLVGKNMNMKQQCALAAQKINSILGSINRGVVAGRKGDVPLCSALLRPYLERCVQAWGLQLKKDAELWELFQRRP